MNIAYALSEKNRSDKKLQKPFIERIVSETSNKIKYSDAERDLFNFIVKEWLWCLPVYSLPPASSSGNRRLIGYRMLSKDKVMEMAFMGI